MSVTERKSLAASLDCGSSTRWERERMLERLLAAVPDDVEQFRSLCSQVNDWSALLECAGRHGVEGVLHHHLTGVGFRLPPALEARAEQQRVFERLGQSRLLETLDQALRAFEASGVRAVALKGPVLAERFYPDPSTRLSSDLDFLVVLDDLDRATAALAAIGYEAETGPSARYYREHTHHIRLSRPRAPLVELHFRVYAGFGIVIPAEEPVARACAYRTTRGAVAWALAPEDEFLHLCLHAAGHRYERLAWLYDVKLLLRCCPHLDWSAVAVRARALNVTRAIAFTGAILRRQLGVPIPVQADLPLPTGTRASVAAWILAATAGAPSSSTPGGLGELGFRAVLCDRPTASARLLRQHLARATRRRAARLLPGILPETWSA